METALSGTFLLHKFEDSPLLKRFVEISSFTDAGIKKMDLRDVKIADAIRLFLSVQMVVPMNVVGLFLLGAARVYSTKLESLRNRMVLLLSSNSDVREPATRLAPGSVSRKRPVCQQTPLAMVPEDESLLFQGDVSFAMPPAIMNSSTGRTPFSNRKRLFGTPRSQQSLEEEAPPEFESTLLLTPPVYEDAWNRRVSSVSEVMDSLRLDDGQRRLSNLIGTGNVEIPPSPLDRFDDFTATDPVSPWVFDEPSSGVKKKRGVLRRRALVDKKGRWGIEINPADLQSRRVWYLSHPFYMKSKQTAYFSTIPYSFSVKELLTDTTSHYSWYKPQLCSSSVVNNDDPVTDMPDDNNYSFNHDGDAAIEMGGKSVEDKLKAHISDNKSVVEVLESVSRHRRSEMVSSFFQVLSLASQNKIRITNRNNEELGFSRRLVSGSIISVI